MKPEKSSSLGDRIGEFVADLWDSFATFAARADAAITGLKIGAKIESLGTGGAGAVVGAVDANIKQAQGKTAEANGTAIGAAAGLVVEPAGVAAQACGVSDNCTNATLHAGNAVLNAPIQPLADFSKGTASSSLAEFEALQHQTTREEGMKKVRDGMQDSADGMKNNGKPATNSFMCGFLGSKSGECK